MSFNTHSLKLATALLLSATATAYASSDINTISLNINSEAGVTVSGVSSGGYMANQFHIAYSEQVTGAGIIAAGPWFCSQGNLMTAFKQCLADGTPLAQQDLSAAIQQSASSGAIDNPENLRNDRVWLLHGELDKRVGRTVNDGLAAQYRAYVDNSNISYVIDKAFNHHFPTLNEGVPCDTTASPYLGNCDYDAASHLIAWLYPGQSPVKPQGGTLSRIGPLDEALMAAAGMDRESWVYVPNQCLKDTQCQVHVSFHGCQQNAAKVDDTYVSKTGLNRQAERYNLVILYPQVADNNPVNPQACWDWWGYTGGDFAAKTGLQNSAVAALVSAITTTPVAISPSL